MPCNASKVIVIIVLTIETADDIICTNVLSFQLIQ